MGRCVSWRAAASLCWLQLFLHGAAALLQDVKTWLCSCARGYWCMNSLVCAHLTGYVARHTRCVACYRLGVCFLWAVELLFLEVNGRFLRCVPQTAVSLLIQGRDVGKNIFSAVWFSVSVCASERCRLSPRLCAGVSLLKVLELFRMQLKFCGGFLSGLNVLVFRLPLSKTCITVSFITAAHSRDWHHMSLFLPCYQLTIATFGSVFDYRICILCCPYSFHFRCSSSYALK